MTVTITLDAHGTTADGTSRGDAAGPILKRAGGFMWSRAQGTWVHNRTWHTGTRTLKARAAHAALVAAGIPCELIEDTAAPAVTTADDVAAFEADRAGRADARAERLTERAERVGAIADATWDRARGMASHIPLGQPILMDHYSAGRDIRYRARINRLEDKAVEGFRDAEETARRAASTVATQKHRESLPTTLRRIAKLEAERRDVQRRLDGDGSHGIRHMDDGTTRHGVPASGEYAARLTVMATEQDAQLAYWRGHVATLEAAGAVVHSRDTIAPGDWVLISGGRWYRVVKTNLKTVALDTVVMPRPLTYPYGDIRGHRTATAHEAAQAPVETP